MQWRKSGRCDTGHCLQVAFRRPRRCDSSACAEVAYRDGQVLVRNNQAPGDVLAFQPADWQAFVDDLPERGR